MKETAALPPASVLEPLRQQLLAAAQDRAKWRQRREDGRHAFHSLDKTHVIVPFIIDLERLHATRDGVLGQLLELRRAPVGLHLLEALPHRYRDAPLGRIALERSHVLRSRDGASAFRLDKGLGLWRVVFDIRIDIGGAHVDLGDLVDRRFGLSVESLDCGGAERGAGEHCHSLQRRGLDRSIRWQVPRIAAGCIERGTRMECDYHPGGVSAGKVRSTAESRADSARLRDPDVFHLRIERLGAVLRAVHKARGSGLPG